MQLNPYDKETSLQQILVLVGSRESTQSSLNYSTDIMMLIDLLQGSRVAS